MRKVGLLSFLLISTASTEPFDEILSLSVSPNGRRLVVCENSRLKVHIFQLTDRGLSRLIQSIGSADVNLRVWIPHRCSWLNDDWLAVSDGSNNVVHFFRRYGRRFRQTAVIGREGGKSLFRQVGRCAAWRDLLFVPDELGNCVFVFQLKNGGSLRAELLTRFGKEGAGAGELNNPVDLTVSHDGLIFVADQGNDRVAVWKWDEEKKTAIPNEPYSLSGFWGCRSVAVTGGKVYALSAYTGEIKSTDISDLKSGRWQIDGGFVTGDERTTTAVHSGHRLPSGLPSLHSLFRDQQVPEVWSFGRYGTPQRRVNDFAIASFGNHKLFAFCRGNEVWLRGPHAAPPTRPMIEPDRRGAWASWKTATDQPTIAEVREAGPFPDLETRKDRQENWIRRELPGQRTNHRLWLGGLKPGTVYRLRMPLWGYVLIADPDKPQVNPWSFEFSFATLPEKGTTTILRIPIALIAYTDVINKDTLTPDAPVAPAISRLYIDYLRYEVDKARLFYWCNSQMTVWLDVDWFFVDKRIWISERERSEIDWRRDLENLLKARGRRLSDYPSAVEIVCERRWDPQRKTYYFQGSGGGTYGADMRPGSSHFLGGSDIAWLFVHEFHHQLDSQFAESGFPEYPFNHFSITPEGFADNFGEHYDGNAWILRNWGEPGRHLWFVNKYGDLVTAEDRDEDKIPDDFSAVPLDERRFGSSPESADTDGDGLTDMQEVLVSSWVRELLPSVNNWRMKYFRPDPTNRDSDGDGLIDGQDPLPLLAASPVIPRASDQSLPDWLTFEEDPTFGPSPSPVARLGRPLKGTVRIGYDQEWLRWELEFSEPVSLIHLQLDFNADGYWVGPDNLDLRINPDWGKATVGWDATVNNGSDRSRWPFPDRSLVPPDHIVATVERDRLRYRYVVRVGVRKTPSIGLDLGSGERLGLAIYLKVGAEGDRWLSVWEPYRLIPLYLQ